MNNKILIIFLSLKESENAIKIEDYNNNNNKEHYCQYNRGHTSFFFYLSCTTRTSDNGGISP